MLRFGVRGAMRLKSRCLPRKEAGEQGWGWRGYGGTQLGAEPLGDAAGAVGCGSSEGRPGCEIGSPQAVRLEKTGFPGTSRQNTPVTPNQSLVFSLYRGALDVGSSHGTHFGLPLKTPEAQPVSEGPHVPQ